MKIGKAVPAVIGTLAAGAGLTLLTGGVIGEATLSKKTVNNSPDDLLDCPGMRDFYNRYPHFKESDDWFVSENPEDTVILNRKGEKIHCNIIKAAKPSRKWAICMHGYTSRPRRMSMQGKHYFDMGFNVLFPVMAAHRTDERKHCSMGYFERYDIVDWINYLVEKDAGAEILLHGCSMGAATAMLVTGENLPSNVKVAVEDCGYTSAWDQFGTNMPEIKRLPRFPFLYAANAYSVLFLGWDFRKCSPIEAVARSVTPTFFIHGKEDTFVPFCMQGLLYDECSAPKGKVEIPDAWHDMSCFMHPELYWSSVDSFIKDYI